MMNINNLKINKDYVNFGSFGKIYKLKNNSNMCFKQLEDCIVEDSERQKFEKKLNYLTTLPDDDEIILPRNVIMNDNKVIGYLTKLMNNYRDSIFLSEYPIDDRIKFLKMYKNTIERMYYSFKIVHADIHSFNLMFNEFDDKICIIDFDTCKVENYDYNSYTNAYCSDFLIHNRPSHLIDITAFNLITYEIMNGIDDEKLALDWIINNKYGVFNQENTKKLIKRLNPPCPNSDTYLIDLI